MACSRGADKAGPVSGFCGLDWSGLIEVKDSTDSHWRCDWIEGRGGRGRGRRKEEKGPFDLVNSIASVVDPYQSPKTWKRGRVARVIGPKIWEEWGDRVG